MIDRMFPWGCWLSTPLPAEAAIHAGSAASVAELVRQTEAPFAPWINVRSWTSDVVVAPLSTPLVEVRLVGSRARAACFFDDVDVTGLMRSLPWGSLQRLAVGSDGNPTPLPV